MEAISELRSVTCCMESHNLRPTCHPTQVNAPHLPSQRNRYLIYLPRRDGRFSWPNSGWLHTEMVY